LFRVSKQTIQTEEINFAWTECRIDIDAKSINSCGLFSQEVAKRFIPNSEKNSSQKRFSKNT